jgi:TPR repeat protein
VGWCLWHGEGTPADYEMAYVWFSVAKILGMKSVGGDMDVMAGNLPPPIDR